MLKKNRDHYFFQASRSAKAHPHPDSKAGMWREELWRYEATEIFFSDAKGDCYLEFNLAPNGSWWACRFGKIRQPAKKQPN
jgi:hypothetical protein